VKILQHFKNRISTALLMGICIATLTQLAIAADSPARLEENEVTKSNLSNLFKSAFFKTSLDSDGNLVVQTDGPKVFVTLDSSHKLIIFMTVYEVKKSARIDLKNQFVNKMNDEFVFVRFSIPKKLPDMLVADYHLPFEEGISTYQVIAAIRLFARIVPNAIRASITDDLVE
jgi:hypothetical protein